MCLALCRLQAVMVTRMRVDPRHIDEFERLLRLILKNTHTIGHVSTCVVKPPPGEHTYTSIVRPLCALIYLALYERILTLHCRTAGQVLESPSHAADLPVERRERRGLL